MSLRAHSPRRWGRLAAGAAALTLLVATLAAGATWAFAGKGKPAPAPAASALPAPEEIPAPPAVPPPTVPPPVAREAAPVAEAAPVREMRSALLPALAPPPRREARLLPSPSPAPDLPPPAAEAAVAAPTAKARPARRVRTEENLLYDLARVPEVGLTPVELQPLVRGWADAFAATFDPTTGSPSYEPLPLLQLRPDFLQLPLRHGRASRLTPREAARLQALSQRMHVYLDKLVLPEQGRLPADPALLRRVLRDEKDGRRPAWRRPEALPTLQQMLMPEATPVRTLLVELLDEITGPRASQALAQQAVFDVSAEVRRRAVAALRKRPRAEYRQALLDALRYPWAPAAEHAAEALVELKDTEVVPYLIGLLKLPDPAAPVTLASGRTVVREVVRLRHVFNCLTCHPPAATRGDPVPGAVPGINFTRITARTRQTTKLERTRGQDTTRNVAVQKPSSPTPAAPSGGDSGGGGGGGYGGGSSVSGTSSSAPTTTEVPVMAHGKDKWSASVSRSRSVKKTEVPLVVRADITYLRQDFSVRLPTPQPGAARPEPLRFDFVVRTRPLKGKEAARLRELFAGQTTYAQREAVLHALRELTGRDAGETAEAWRRLYPEAELDARAGRLAEELVSAPESRREELLARYQSARGVVYSEALAAAVPRLSVAWRDRARQALAERLARMKATTLRDKLQQEDAETRRAAARACLIKGDDSLAGDLVSLLEDGEPAVGAEARRALEGLTGKKFDSPAQWREWRNSAGAETASARGAAGGE